MPANRAVVYEGPGKVDVKNIDYPSYEMKDGPGVNKANIGRRTPHAAILKTVTSNMRPRPATPNANQAPTVPAAAERSAPPSRPSPSAPPASPGLAAARAAAAAGAARQPTAKPASPPKAWSDGSPTEEAPYDPEFDGPPAAAAYDGFDPGDEHLDDVIDEKSARQNSEQQAMQLLRDTFGAEKISEIQT